MILKTIRGAVRWARNRLLRCLTRIWLPGFKRIYCADPNIAFMGLDMRGVQWTALLRGIQVIWFDRKERELRAVDCEQSGATEVVSAVTEDSELLRLIEYSVAVDAEVQFSEMDAAISAGRGNSEQYLARAEHSLQAIRRDLKRFRPHMILLAQGFGIEAIAARRCAVQSGLSLLAFENTALKDRMVWEPISGVTVNRNIARSMYWRFMDTIPAQAIKDFCDEIIASTKQNKQEEHASPDAVWQSDSCRPVVLYLGQVYTDSSLLYGCYRGLAPEQVVQSLYDWCDANGAQLVLKLHPKEANGVAPVTHRSYNKLTMRKLEGVFAGSDALSQPWVTIDSENQWDTYRLIETADLVVTINSQAGLEAAIRGKNVVTSGRCFYAGLDFTTDVTSADEMAEALSKSISSGYSAERHALAQKFFYVFFKKYCIEKQNRPLVELFRIVMAFRF
jgi:hypothetical protein